MSKLRRFDITSYQNTLKWKKNKYMKARSTRSMKTTSFYSLSTSRISVREDQRKCQLPCTAFFSFLFFSFLLQGHTSCLLKIARNNKGNHHYQYPISHQIFAEVSEREREREERLEGGREMIGRGGTQTI
jgi:hypothetical protein